MLRVEYGRKFAKQAERCRRRGKDLGKFKEIVRKLANGESLEKKHHNHYFENRRVWECHIEPDWLLIYRIDHDTLILELLETGTHSDLFGEPSPDYRTDIP